MKFIDISHDKQTTYTLSKDEQCVFFMQNRTGEITIELAGPGAQAHVFALYTGRGAAQPSLRLVQRHLAPRTVSTALVKSTVSSTSTFTYEGLIHIEKQAGQSDASQESRALLLSPTARVFAQPALEILADDVTCHHAATVSPLSSEQIFFAESRGLSKTQAEKLLVNGFFKEALERMEELGVKTERVRKKIVDTLV